MMLTTARLAIASNRGQKEGQERLTRNGPLLLADLAAACSTAGLRVEIFRDMRACCDRRAGPGQQREAQRRPLC